MRTFFTVEDLDLSNAGKTIASQAITAEGFSLNDRNLNRQWYYEGSSLSDLHIDAYPAWEDYSGQGVKVGVLDSQIDFTHPDLARAYDTALDYNFALDTGKISIDPKNYPHYHGTFVAGIIAAEANNEFGIAGIAAGSTLVGLGVDYAADNVADQIVRGLGRAAELDVINNSWRFVENFGDSFYFNPQYEAVLENAVQNGRGGLGTSVVFAAGNAGASGSSNYNNFQNSPYTIAVGAVDPDGRPSGFTSIGSNVLLSAAGSTVFSTDLQHHFDNGAGTSFAAPAVSGAIALLYEANPDLGYRDVQQILAYSARREGLSDDRLHGDGWQTNGATNHNGGGLHFSDAFGYGFLNVHDAVRLAESWQSQQTFANLTEITKVQSVGQTLVAGRNDTISIDIEVTETVQVEHVQVAMNFKWRNSADLDVYLTSPDGTSVRLIYDLPGSSSVGSFRFFDFSSVASMGELSAGTWRIDIVNHALDVTNNKGEALAEQVRDVTLTILGREEGLADDTYIYTDELATLYSGKDLAERSVLRDEDGGKDTINAAAVTTASRIDLSGASATSIAGVHLDIGKGAIENAIGGDGDDTLIGTVRANTLLGGRGDDAFTFTNGNDLLDGQQGSDTLFVDAAFAAISGYVTTVGDVALSAFAGAVSIIRGIEYFVFSDARYSLDQLVARLDGGTIDKAPVGDKDDSAGTADPLPEPEPEAPAEEETPAGQDPAPDAPDDAPRAPEPGTGMRSFDQTLTGGEAFDRLVGGDQADLAYGLGGDDKLLGRAGDDELHGGKGDDRALGGTGKDDIYGEDGNDILIGEEGADRLYGGAGNDILYGDEGADWIQGGLGADRMKGGSGADTFVFDLSEIDALDLILDFNAEEGDRILITGFSGSAANSLHLVEVGAYTFLQVDGPAGPVDIARISGNGLADLEFQTSEAGYLFA